MRSLKEPEDLVRCVELGPTMISRVTWEELCQLAAIGMLSVEHSVQVAELLEQIEKGQTDGLH